MAGVGLHVWVLDVTEPRLRAQPLASLAKSALLCLGPQLMWRIWAGRARAVDGGEGGLGHAVALSDLHAPWVEGRFGADAHVLGQRGAGAEAPT